MKVEHSVKRFEMGGVADLKIIADYTRANYDPNTFTCKEVCEGLARKFNNLVAVKVPILIHNGIIESQCHYVCKVRGTRYIIDPTADQFDYENPSKLKKQISPWIYFAAGKEHKPNTYYSMNHNPMGIPEELIREKDEEPYTQWDILTLSNSPMYKELKVIIL